MIERISRRRDGATRYAAVAWPASCVAMSFFSWAV
jgi:hypothetical protein